MKDGIGLPEIVKKLVSKAPAFMGIRHEPGNIHEVDWDKPNPVSAAFAGKRELFAGANGPVISHPEIGVNSGEGIVGDFCGGHGCRPEKCRFPAIRLPRKGERNHTNSL